MAGQVGPRCAPPDAITLLASAISYALGACVQVAPGEMTLPTPCTDWDLEALLAHLAASMADLESALRTGYLDLDPDDPAAPDPDGADPDPDGAAPDPDPAAPDPDGADPDPDGAAPDPDPAAPDPDGAAPDPDPAAPDPGGADPVEVLRDRAANLLFACYAHHSPDRFVLVGGLPLPAGIVACTGAVEIAVHGWDVRAARGRGDPIPPALAIRMLRLGPLLVTGREGLFGTPVQVPSQASPGDQLVAYLGRTPWHP